MIVLKLEGDRGYVPTIICDFCAEPIAGPTQGVVGWPLVPAPGEDDAARKQFYFAHRKTCDQTLDAAEGATMWMDIEEFVAALAESVNPPGTPGS